MCNLMYMMNSCGSDIENVSWSEKLTVFEYKHDKLNTLFNLRLIITASWEGGTAIYLSYKNSIYIILLSTFHAFWFL